MNVLLVLLLVALVATFLVRHSAPQVLRPVLAVLVCVTLVVAAWSTYRNSSRGRIQSYEQEQQLFQKSIGYRLGQALGQDIPEDTVVLVLYELTDSSAGRKEGKAFMDGIEEGFGGKSYEVVRVGLENISNAEGMSVPPPLTADLVAQVMKEHPEAAGLISHIGRPQLDPADGNGHLPLIYAFTYIGETELEPLLQMDILRAGVHYRANPDWQRNPNRRMSLDEIFELRFQLSSSRHE